MDFVSIKASNSLQAKSHLASSSSKSLFTMVALSIVIFFPIDQFGCFRASSGAIFSISSNGVSRNAPPLAVMQRRFMGRLECRYQSPKCSLSIGIIDFVSKKEPAATRDSLFARATFLPKRCAFIVGAKPKNPTRAFTTRLLLAS